MTREARVDCKRTGEATVTGRMGKAWQNPGMTGVAVRGRGWSRVARDDQGRPGDGKGWQQVGQKHTNLLEFRTPG